LKRLLIISAALLALLLLAAVIAWWWLTATRGGANFLLDRAAPMLDRVTWQRLDGNLRDGLSLRGLEVGHEGVEFSAGRVDLAARVRLLSLGVQVEHLRIIDGRLVLPESQETPDEPFELGDYPAPVDVRLEAVELVDFQIVTGPGAEPLEIQRFEFSGRYAQALEIDRVLLRMQPLSLDGNGRIGLSRPWPVALSLALEAELEQDLSQHVNLELAGELADLDIDLNASGPAELAGRLGLRGLPDPAALNATLALSGQLDGWPGVAGSARNLELNASGSLEDWQATLAGQLSWPELPEAGFTVEVAGDDQRLVLEAARIDTLDGRILLTGEAGLAEPYAAMARLQLENLDFTQLYPDWPDQARLSGRLNADWDGNRLEIDQVELRAPPAPLRLTGRASYQLDDEQLALSLQWQSLTWPPVLGDDQPPLFSSRAGTLEASGTLAEWQAELEAWMALPGQPEARIELSAEGDEKQVVLQRTQVGLGDVGTAHVVGSIHHAEPFSARLELQLEAFDPGTFVAELPGRVDGDLVLNVDSLDPLVTGIEIRSLSGNLRQVPLSGSGQARLSGEHFEQGELILALGDNQVSLASSDGRIWQLEVDGRQLDQLWPDLSGSLQLNASVDPVERVVDWTLGSDGAAWLDFRVASADAGGRVDFGDTPMIRTRIDAQDVDLNPWERLDRVELRLDGDCARHALSLYMGGTRATLDLAASGSLPDCMDGSLDSVRWNGELERLNIADTPVGAWQLDRPLPIRLEAGTLRAGPACLWTTGSDGRLCLNDLDAGETGRAVVAFNSVPLDLLLLPADPVFTLDSELRGLVRLQWGADGLDEVDATLLVGEGALRMLDADEDLVRIRGSRLRLQSPEPGSLDADLVLRLEQQSEITASARVPNINALETAEIDAHAALNLPNLGAFNRLVPQLDRMAGRVEADLRATGRLLSPDLNGSLAVREAAFLFAPLGSRVEDLELELIGDAGGGRLEGGFTAGSGRARIAGTLDLTPEQSWKATASVQGSELTMFNVKWLEMTVSPDAQVSIAPELLELDGELVIDRARLGMPPGADDRVAASPDVVVVGDEEADEEAEPAPIQQISGNLKLVLSDNVRLAAAGLETNLAGQLDMQWTPGRPLPEARGTIRLVDGSYRAFGQNLEVSQGDVLFTGNPVDNPVLQIEAVREIFGDPLVEVAGVQIRGPAQNPNIELFTSPPTSREKALAYVLTGADFDHAEGQGAFSVGFWVLPNIFVSYGLGLFDTGNVLAARWELSRRWGLRATSGERDTGADVSFIIDR